MDQPWYANGLRFKCARCAACCAGPAEAYVWVDEQDIERIADYLEDKGASPDDLWALEVRQVGQRQAMVMTDNNDCPFLQHDDEGRSICEIYPVRPAQCEAWPFWSRHLYSLSYWCRTRNRCPGIDQGELVQFDEIERKRSASAQLVRG